MELGQADIVVVTSALSLIMVLPREGHLDAVFHMFVFLKRKHNGVMVFDPTETEIDINKFPREDWSATPYGVCKEEIPSNAPEPRGIAFTMRAFVDSEYAGDMIT